MTGQPLNPALPEGVDTQGYTRIRGLMRLCVLRVWRSEHVIAGMDPWVVVDEAWGSMAQNGFRSEGPFEPFAMRVARNKAIDSLSRAEARRRDRSLDEPITAGDRGPGVLADVVPGSPGADADYFSGLDHLDALRRLGLAEEGIYRVLSETERAAFLAVRVSGRSRAAVGREFDPPITGQRVGQIIAGATIKIRRYVEQHEERP